MIKTLNKLEIEGNSTNLRRRQWHPTPVLLPGKSHGQRSLVGYSPWSREESDMTEQLHMVMVVIPKHYDTDDGLLKIA